MAAQKNKVPQRRNAKSISRRDFIKTVTAGMVATGLGANIMTPRKVCAAEKKLKILQWSHFVPSFDRWLEDTYVKEWGQKNDTEVIIDHISILELLERPAAEVAAQKGHDLVMFIRPPSAFEEHVVDLSDICQECENLHGHLIPLAHRSTYNPKTKKYLVSLTAMRQIRSTTARIYGMAWVFSPIPGRMCLSVVRKSKRSTESPWVSASLKETMTLEWPFEPSCTLMGPLSKTRGKRGHQLKADLRSR